MSQMRAARIHGWRSAPRVDVVPMPSPGEGESLIRVEAAALSHLDATVASGTFDLKPQLPYIPGVEGCGTVVESSELAAGARVLIRGGGLGIVRPGTWAEFVVAKNKALTPMPDGLSAAVAATFFQPATTAHVSLHDVARLGTWDESVGSSDEVVVVAGAAGAVGSMLVQLALRAGARVIGYVGLPEQAGLVPAGAEVITADDERLALLDEERAATLVIDTLGGPELPRRAHWVRPGGRAVLIGYVAGTDASLDLPNWLLDDVALLPVNMMRREAAARACAAELIELLVSGQLTLSTQSFGLEDTGTALDLLGSGGLTGRAALVPTPGPRVG